MDESLFLWISHKLSSEPFDVWVTSNKMEIIILGK